MISKRSTSHSIQPQDPIQTTWGKLETPLGVCRLKIVEFFVIVFKHYKELIQIHPNIDIKGRLRDCGVLRACVVRIDFLSRCWECTVRALKDLSFSCIYTHTGPIFQVREEQYFAQLSDTHHHVCAGKWLYGIHQNCEWSANPLID